MDFWDTRFFVYSINYYIMNQQLTCLTHRIPKSLICLTEGCNTLVCPECTQTHRATHEKQADQKIMNFSDVLLFSVESQVLTPYHRKKLFSDSLTAHLKNMNESDFYQEVQAKIKVIKGLKQSLRNIIRDYFD